MTYEEELKGFIRRSEERFIWYKQELANVFKDKTTFPPGDEFTEWYKEFLRENKNREEQWLKANQEEILYFRQGLNPPYCYSNTRKRKDTMVEAATANDITK